MKDSLRLRLVIRRHDLPEVRVLFSLPLRDEPTVADLLSQVNDTVPLESPDWGLDDYAVEVEDSAGTAFECLHFQPVATILDKDEQVIIRPLFTVDRKKRLLSGRDQIASDGKHLLDGVPFGRPRLRAPRGRPPVDIPPLKRRRIAFGEGDGEELNIDDEEDEEDDGDYQDDADFQDDEAEDSAEEEDSPLMLTEFGEDPEELGGVRIAAVFDDADGVEEEQVDDPLDEGLDEELDEELDGDLHRDVDDELDLELDADLDEELDQELDEAELVDELRDILMDNELLGDGSLNPAEAELQQSNVVDPTPDSDLDRLNKITALRRAFPAGDCHLYQDVLQSHDWNEAVAYRELKRSCEASMSLKEMQDLLASFSSGVRPRVGDCNGEEDREEAESDAESASSLVKRYDQHGFPSGSILDGSASRAAAAALRSAGHKVKPPVLTRFDDGVTDHAKQVKTKTDSTKAREVEERGPKNTGRLAAVSIGKTQARQPAVPAVASETAEDEEESESDFESSSSSGSEEDSGDDSEDEEEADDTTSGSESGSGSDSDSGSNSYRGNESRGNENESDSSGESDSEDDSGPEVLSAILPPQTASKGAPRTEPTTGFSQSKKRKGGPGATENVSDEDSSSSDDSSDSSLESDDDSSDGSSSDGSSESAIVQRAAPGPTVAPAKATLPRATAASKQSQPSASIKETPPGQGLTRTQMRNKRRKLALQARRAAAAAEAARLPNEATHPSTAVATAAEDIPGDTVRTTDSEFEKRRQALLESLANNNTVLGEDALVTQVPASQLKTTDDGAREQTAQATPAQPPASETISVTVETSSQRRSTLDVGAGRRMLFASLGLKNPKTKADEDKIRGELMKGVRPLVNHRISESSATEQDKSVEDTPAEGDVEDENPDAWRDKINYTAVECVQEGVELSEPPFPFVQRWDPQQQNFWKDKRGGKGKRKQRNQTEFYEDDSTERGSKKQRLDHVEVDDFFGLHGSFAADAAEDTQELNYDDIPDAVSRKLPADQPSQMTDLDDLPSLPKDLTTLPSLTQSDAQPGMVITWKQMILSKATNWAPQVLDLAAVIVSIDEASEELRVVLARRDRHLDGKEKTIDEDGNRVYDRFDGPDDEDSEDDGVNGNNEEGYRTIQYSDMTDPRIVQQPLPLPEKTALRTTVESQVKQADKVMADSDDRLASDGTDKEIASIDAAEVSTALSNRQDSANAADEVPSGADGEQPRENQDESSFGSVIPDSVPIPALEQPVNAAAVDQEPEAGDISMTDDRRHDISAIIRDAGFRTDVPLTITREARFSIEDLSSPSRQLSVEMSESAAIATAMQAPGPVQVEVDQSSDAPPDAVVPSSDGSMDELSSSANERDTPRADRARDTTLAVSYPELPVPSSAGSVRSGRQPDNDIGLGWGDDDHLLPPSEDLGEGLPMADDSHVETTTDNNPTPTKPERLGTSSDSGFDSSPLPTLDEIFCTASQARATQSPVTSKLSAAAVVKSRRLTTKHDIEYEEMMRRIDDSEPGWDQDQVQIKNILAPIDDSPPGAQPPSSSINWDDKLGRIKEERWSQSVTAAVGAEKEKTENSKPASFHKVVSPPASSRPRSSLAAVKKEQVASSQSLPPLSQPKRRRTTAASQRTEDFVIPEGSEVVTLLTSSPEPEVEEHYAEDSIDSTYEDPDGGADSDLPDGSGWVKKTVSAKGKRSNNRTRRGVSLSALPARKGDPGTVNGKRPSSSMTGAGRKTAAGQRRKASARF